MLCPRSSPIRHKTWLHSHRAEPEKRQLSHSRCWHVSTQRRTTRKFSAYRRPMSSQSRLVKWLLAWLSSVRKFAFAMQFEGRKLRAAQSSPIMSSLEHRERFSIGRLNIALLICQRLTYSFSTKPMWWLHNRDIKTSVFAYTRISPKSVKWCCSAPLTKRRWWSSLSLSFHRRSLFDWRRRKRS